MTADPSPPVPTALPDGRPLPRSTGEERPMLEERLEHQRGTLALQCAGPDDAQARRASAEPSSPTPPGLVQHLAEVERNRFQRVIAGLDVPRRCSRTGAGSPSIPRGGRRDARRPAPGGGARAGAVRGADA